MRKALPTFLVIVALILGLLLAIYAIRFEMLRTQTAFLMQFVQLENATVSEYEAEFGKAIQTAQSVEQLHPELANAIEGTFSEGQTIYVLPARTIPHKFLVLGCDANGRVVWRTWLPM